MQDSVAIVGAAGAVGRAMVDELERRGARTAVIARDRQRLERLFGARAEIRAADIANIEDAARALEGCGGAVYCVGLPYPQFDRHPVLMRCALEAARKAGVRRMIVVSSVYSYGHPRAARVSEEHPREPETRKGRFRKEQEDAAMDAHGRGGLATLVLHLPDFYGPYATNSLACMMLASLQAGKPARWLGDPDAPHEFVFMPDAARVIAELLARPECFGRRWNLAGAGAISGREFAALAARELNRPARVAAVGRLMLRLGGIFSPLLRELVELQYLGETPVLLDDGALRSALGSIGKTPYEEGVPRMLEWLKQEPV